MLIVDTYYPAFLAAHYDARPHLARRPYAEQLDALLEQSFGTSDAYSYHLRELGHEAMEIVANCTPLQLRWAAENGFRPRVVTQLERRLPGRAGALARRTVLNSLALAQIADSEADVVYVQDLWFFSGRALRTLRCQGRLVVGQIASPPPSARHLKAFDLITTSFPHFVERFRRLGVDSEYFKIAFYEGVLERLQRRGIDPARDEERAHGVTFVGALHSGVHDRRTRTLERVAGDFDAHVWGYGLLDLPAESPLRRRYRGEAWGLAMYEVLARSKITLNRHSRAAAGFANNMRLFEATGMGALLFTEAAPNLAELFEPDQEVVTYANDDELVEKLRHYSAHDDERRQVARAGRERTLSEHTYARRIPELAEMLEARLR